MEGVMKGLGLEMPSYIKELYFSITTPFADEKPKKIDDSAVSENENQSKCVTADEEKLEMRNLKRECDNDNANEMKSKVLKRHSSLSSDEEKDVGGVKPVIPKQLKLEPEND